MAKFDLVLFDLGATLIFFNGDWEAALKEGILSMQGKLKELGYAVNGDFPVHYRETAREYYRWRDDNLSETPAPAVFRQIMASYCCDDIPQEHVNIALTALYSATQARWNAEEDAVPTLALLQHAGYRIGLVSNAGYDDDVQVLVDKAGLRPYLQFIISSATAGVRKPHPDIFQAALDFFGVQPAQAVMVGDFLQADVLGANHLGMGSVWITRRIDTAAAQPLLAKIQPDRTIGALAELPSVLNSWD